MVVGSVNANYSSGAVQMPMQQGTDPVSKNIQNRIANAQKQMQELGENKELSLEEKMKRRQEIQQQINDLQNELRQHQIDQRKEKQQKNSASSDDMFGNTDQSQKSFKSSAGMSTASMQAIISADSSMKQVKVQGAAKREMEGRADVLKAEIKLDSGRGGNVDKKMEELAEVESRAQNIESSQMKDIADINKELEEASKTDRASDEKSDKTGNKSGINGNIAENRETDKENSAGRENEIEITGEIKKDNHEPIDIVSAGITTSTGTVAAEGKEVDVKL